MENYKILKIQDNKELITQACEWFHQKWGIPKEDYMQSMEECIKSTSPIPQWYIVLDKEIIIAGIGVIENDFHNRKDLTPNVCAVYVEPLYRNQGIAGKLLQFVCDEFKAKGINTLYLLTEHIGFYEKYGWEFLCMVQGNGEPNMSRMYVHRI